MKLPLNAWLLIVLLVLGSVCLAANKKEDEGGALIERAKQVSDIRADGAPSFRLKVSFRTYKAGSETTVGTYTEVWASKGKWRSETTFGDYRLTTVANGKKRWTLNQGFIRPTGIDEIGFRMEPMRYSPLFWKPEKLEDRVADSVAVRCIETKPVLGGKAILCFDKNTATIVTKTLSEQVTGGFVDKECTYGDYQKFGEKMFPWTIRCLEDHVLVFEEAVVELAVEPSPDTTLFAPLPEGKESPICPGNPTPPKAVYTPAPVPPRRENPKNPVVLWLIVGTDGKPRDITVVRSVDNAFDAAAVEAVQRWRFKTGTCDGEPIETQINVDINFRSY